jgi:hypothetical protein
VIAPYSRVDPVFWDFVVLCASVLQRFAYLYGIVKKKHVCSCLALKHALRQALALRQAHAEMTAMPPSYSSSPEPPEPFFTAPILARLAVQIPVSGMAKKKGTRKETKTKEFSHCFSATKSNYVQLLNTILAKHHIGNRFQATERRHYGCKIQVPPAK